MFKRIIMLLVALVFPIALAAQESPLTIVSKVLALSDEQTQTLGGIVQARSEAIASAVQEVRTREQVLGQQLQSSDPDPLTVGRLIIEIKHIQDQIHQAIEETNRQFETVLTPEQSARLQQIRATEPVCGVIPAFKAVGLM
jgi:Spy/CpxP family protein refolding chaperone